MVKLPRISRIDVEQLLKEALASKKQGSLTPECAKMLLVMHSKALWSNAFRGYCKEWKDEMMSVSLLKFAKNAFKTFDLDKCSKGIYAYVMHGIRQNYMAWCLKRYKTTDKEAKLKQSLLENGIYV